MQTLLSIARVIDAVNGRIGRFAAWLGLLMVLIGAYNALGRYIGRYIGQNLTLTSFNEMQWYLFAIIFLMCAGWTLERDGHVRVDIAYGRAGPRTQAWIDLAGSILFLIPFCLLIIWLSRGFVGQSIAILEQSPDPGGLPRWPIKLAIPVAFGLLALQGVAQAIKAAAVLTGDLDRHRPPASGPGQEI